MGNSLKWGGITLSVLAGALIGFALSTFAYRHGYLGLPGPHAFIERLNRELNLSPDQLHQIQSLLHDTREKMHQLHEDFDHQHDQLILQTHDQIRALLNPEQQEKFDREFTPPVGHEHPHHPPND